MGISNPLHLDWTATSNHRTGKYSARLPEPASEGEMADPAARTSKYELGLQNYLKNLSIITHYASLTVANIRRAETQDIENRTGQFVNPSGTGLGQRDARAVKRRVGLSENSYTLEISPESLRFLV